MLREVSSLEPVRVCIEYLGWLRLVLFPFSMIDLGRACYVILNCEVRESLLGTSGKDFLIPKRKPLEEIASSSSGPGGDWI